VLQPEEQPPQAAAAAAGGANFRPRLRSQFARCGCRRKIAMATRPRRKLAGAWRRHTYSALAGTIAPITPYWNAS